MGLKSTPGENDMPVRVIPRNLPKFQIFDIYKSSALFNLKLAGRRTFEETKKNYPNVIDRNLPPLGNSKLAEEIRAAARK